jgi:hypothetical protein
MSRRRGGLGRWLLAAVAAGSVACRSKEPEGFGRFAPPPEVARRAVAAALEDWKSGRPPGRVAGARPAVQVVDGHREPDRALKDFAILGNAPDEGSRLVTARLILTNPEGRAVVRYRVLGTDPIWVIRQEDLDMITHWEHATSPDDEGGASGAAEGPAGPSKEGAGNVAKAAETTKHDHDNHGDK